MLKQSFTWWSYASPQTDPETLLRRAAEIGYDGVEMLDEELFSVARAMGPRNHHPQGARKFGKGVEPPRPSRRHRSGNRSGPQTRRTLGDSQPHLF